MEAPGVTRLCAFRVSVSLVGVLRLLRAANTVA